MLKDLIKSKNLNSSKALNVYINTLRNNFNDKDNKFNSFYLPFLLECAILSKKLSLHVDFTLLTGFPLFCECFSFLGSKKLKKRKIESCKISGERFIQIGPKKKTSSHNPLNICITSNLVVTNTTQFNKRFF